MWVQIELPEAAEVSGVILDGGEAENDFPQGYKVELSLDGNNWGQPVASGNGTCAYTQIIFPTAVAKFIKITQTGSHPTYFWSIYELQLLQPATARNVEVAKAEPPKAETPKADLPPDPFYFDPLAPAPAGNDNPAPAPVKSPLPTPPATPVVPPPPPKVAAPSQAAQPSASASSAHEFDIPSHTAPAFLFPPGSGPAASVPATNAPSQQPLPPGFATARPAAPVPAPAPPAPKP
jgi:hypothetical protein